MKTAITSTCGIWLARDGVVIGAIDLTEDRNNDRQTFAARH